MSVFRSDENRDGLVLRVVPSASHSGGRTCTEDGRRPALAKPCRRVLCGLKGKIRSSSQSPTSTVQIQLQRQKENRVGSSSYYLTLDCVETITSINEIPAINLRPAPRSELKSEDKDDKAARGSVAR